MFRAIRSFDERMGTLAGVIFVGISLLIVADVTARFIAAPLGGATEIAESLLVLAIALAFADTQRVGGHISIDLFVDMMSRPVRLVVDVVNKLVCLLLVSVIAYGLIRAAAHSVRLGEYQFSTAGNIPIWPAKCALAFGFALLAVEFAFQLAEAARGHRVERQEGDVGTNV